jgi:hypothetical protein
MKMNGENGTCAHKVGSTDFINNKRNEKKRKSSQGNRGKEKGKRGEMTRKRGEANGVPTRKSRGKSQIPTPLNNIIAIYY